MVKDLGQELENVEESVENLKNKEFRILGLKVSFMSVSALVAVLGSVLGALYGGFLMYQKVEEAIAFVDQQQEYEEKISDYDNRMQIIETQLDEAIGYARDIKGDLRDDILSIEKSVDRMDDKVREVESEVREIIQNAEERFENKRDGLQNDYDTKANRLQESNQSRMDDLEAKVERDLKNLEDRLSKKLQRALDNPLAN
jgi:prefoldin subunit 5|tara:strand:- start:1261 stop:1860 length:600 start_codon:yes stop_codon:yes gene_type:complete